MWSVPLVSRVRDEMKEQQTQRAETTPMRTERYTYRRRSNTPCVVQSRFDGGTMERKPGVSAGVDTPCVKPLHRAKLEKSTGAEVIPHAWYGGGENACGDVGVVEFLEAESLHSLERVVDSA